jgi:hypothetical protein
MIVRMGVEAPSPRAGSPEWQVLLRPGVSYAGLAELPRRGMWLFWRRPLLLTLILGCAISLMTARRLELRLVLSAGLTWTFVSLLEIGSLALVWRWHRPPMALARTVDLFFTGNVPWSLWLIGSGLFWATFPELAPSRLTAYGWFGSAGVAIAWSAWLDFCFWRSGMKRSFRDAIRDLLAQRVLAWVPGVLIIGAASLWVDLVRLWP